MGGGALAPRCGGDEGVLGVGVGDEAAGGTEAVDGYREDDSEEGADYDEEEDDGGGEAGHARWCEDVRSARWQSGFRGGAKFLDRREE